MLVGTFVGFSQNQNGPDAFVLRGKVALKKSSQSVSGIAISSTTGDTVLTNGLGRFEITTKIGDELLIEDERI